MSVFEVEGEGQGMKDRYRCLIEYSSRDEDIFSGGIFGLRECVSHKTMYGTAATG